jgi:galactonate dehydratase
MKITTVEVFDTNTEVRSNWHPVIVRINTDEGVSGLGEVGLAYGTGHTAGAAMVKDLAEQFVIGADPMKTEMLWETMFRATFWAKGGGPVVFGGMSAIDTALWDIKGKALDVPVYQLLGGKTNGRLRTYASQIQFGWSKDVKVCKAPEEYAEEARRAVSDGYDCVKVDPIMFDAEGERIHMLRGVVNRGRFNLFRDRMKAIREAVGPDVDVIIELHSLLGATAAIQLGKVWEEFDCMFYEEPVNYLNIDLHRKVSRSLRLPSSAGERIYTRWGYRQYFEKQVLDIIQPDLGLVGGITEGKKICDYADVYDVGVQVHVCGSPVATAASLQLEAAIPNFVIHEHHVYALREDNIKLCRQNYQPKGGRFEVPDLPGLGIELDDDAVSNSTKFTVK